MEANLEASLEQKQCIICLEDLLKAPSPLIRLSPCNHFLWYASVILKVTLVKIVLCSITRRTQRLIAPYASRLSLHINHTTSLPKNLGRTTNS